MSPAHRALEIAFADADAFAREYRSNLANGGAFVESGEALELREAVEVELCLPFCGQKLLLDGEVVHVVPPAMAAAGGRAGVAVQFRGSASDVRAQLQPLLAACGIDPAATADEGDRGRRRSPRVAARVAARIDRDGEAVAGHTRDLSRSGVLVSVPGEEVPIGQRVQLALVHPTTGETMDVAGTVVRRVESEGGVSAIGVEFDAPDDERGRVDSFVERIQSAEHARRLGGIAGAIEELGPQSLLQMFGTTAAAGTLALRRGAEEGLIGFEAGVLRYARLGSTSGMKALTRLLSWRDGTFEFHSRLDDVGPRDAPLPLEAALFEAVRQLDEVSCVDTRRFPLDAKPRLVGEPEAGRPSKTEEAVLDLARAGFPVRRMLEVIPEPDPEIFRALASLADAEVIRFDT